jgi:hypothetical protein
MHLAPKVHLTVPVVLDSGFRQSGGRTETAKARCHWNVDHVASLPEQMVSNIDEGVTVLDKYMEWNRMFAQVTKVMTYQSQSSLCKETIVALAGNFVIRKNKLGSRSLLTFCLSFRQSRYPCE